VKPPAPLRQDAKGRPPNSFGVWLRAGVPVLGTTALLPAEAFAATPGLESIPIVVLVAGLGLALSFLVAVAAAVTTLLRRSRDAANEARRLNALLDMLDEGVAVCAGMQAVAVNTSLCRLIGIDRDEVGT
jgi:PAS domain-containing protein